MHHLTSRNIGFGFKEGKWLAAASTFQDLLDTARVLSHFRQAVSLTASAPVSPPSSTEAGRLAQALSLYKGLVEVCALINAITDFDQLLTAVMEVARRVMQAEGSALILKNEITGDLEIIVARRMDREVTSAHQIIPRGRGLAGWVLDHGESVLVPDAYADPRFFSDVDKKTGYRTRSILAVPLKRLGTTVGVLEVLNCLQPGKDAFDAEDLEAFEAYANLAATAIEKLRYLEQERRRARFERELSIATEIQKNFLPRSLPKRADVDFAAHYRPAREVGGDFYDLYEIAPDELYFVIGDVAGKGIPAALLMAQALSALRLIIAPGVGPAKAMALWNQTLCRQALRGLFITATLGRIIPSRQTVEIACAGHCCPLWAHGAEGVGVAVKEVALDRSPPLAILPDAAFETNSLSLGVGDVLVFFTDGLTESRAPAERGGEQLGVEGAQGLLKNSVASASEIVENLSRGETEYRGDAVPLDDLTLFAFGFL